MATKKTSKLFAFDESTKRSSPTKQMFTVRMLGDDTIKDIGVYKEFEDAEFELIRYLKKGACCWIVSNNE